MSSGKYRQQDVRAARGTTLTAKSWLTEAPLRMLMNNLDPEVAENPHELVVYGGIGRAARNWECYDAIVESLTHLEHDETLLVQSGKPVGVFKTHKNAPRVLIANSNLVPHWATWEHFNELDAKGLAMYGQMTAGSWIYIGSQGIVQGTYETFVEAGRQHYNGSLKGRWVLTAGLGGMGGAQPLAATLAGACSLNIECQQSRIDFRLRTRYVDEQAENLDDALARIKKYTSEGKAMSIALCGNAADILPELVARGVRPDLVTDQTSAHDPLHGYLPSGWTWEAYQQKAESDPEGTVLAAKRSMAEHVNAMLAFSQMGIPTFDYGNNIRQMAKEMGVSNAFDFPGFVPAYIRPLFCRGIGPFRWVALSGDPEDIYKTDAKVKEIVADDEHLHHWLDMTQFADIITISQMTPGPIALNSATFVGIRIAGLPGALVATLGCIFPSLFIVSLLAFIYYRYKNLSILQSVLASLRPAVVALIASAGLSILLQVVFGGAEMAIVNVNWVGLVLFAAAFAALRGLKWNPILVMVLCGVGNLLVGLVLQTIG